MNMILYSKIKQYFKNKNEEEIKNIVLELQDKFNISENSNVFEIEKNITDEEFLNFIKSNN